MRCIGALCDSGRSIRLLDENGDNWPTSSEFKVAQWWDLEFDDVPNSKPPHLEDVRLKGWRYIAQAANARQEIERRVQPWRGHPSVLFDRAVNYSVKRNGYIESKVPDRSTGFWVPDKELVLRDDGKHYDYVSRLFNKPLQHGLSYVGEAESIPSIPAGSLVRISLARWWRHPDSAADFPERCSLQLSGWY